MSASKPKLNLAIDVTQLPLSAEEGFVLSRVDGHTDEKGISQVTGLPPDRVATILQKLRAEGAIVDEQGALAPQASNALAKPHKRKSDDNDVPPATPSDEDADATQEAQEAEGDSGEAAEETHAAQASGDEDRGEGDDDSFDDDDVEENVLTKEEAEAEEEDLKKGEEDYRRLYVDDFKEMELDQRVKTAQTARGPALCALCFDPDPRVIKSVLENGRVNQKHGRLVAKHHRTSTGLDMLGRKATLLRDFTVQRFLVRNPQMSDGLFRKMMQNKRLLDCFKMTNNREATEKVRRLARKNFRTRFQRAQAEERVQLLFTTEGRCLVQLAGVPLDGKTLSILCGRTYSSSLLIQNLARFPSTSPKLLVHLSKQHIVKRAPQLKNAILQHPNCPSSLKRGK